MGLHYEEIEITNEAELLKVVYEALKDPFNQKKKIAEVLSEIGFTDTLTLVDERIKQLLDMYQFYKYAPQSIKNGVWYQSYIIMSTLEEALRPRLM